MVLEIAGRSVPSCVPDRMNELPEQTPGIIVEETRSDIRERAKAASTPTEGSDEHGRATRLATFLAGSSHIKNHEKFDEVVKIASGELFGDFEPHVKYRITLRDLKTATEKWGKVDPPMQSKDLFPKSESFDFICEFLEFLEQYQEVFHDQMPKQDYDELLRRSMGEIIKPAYFFNSDEAKASKIKIEEAKSLDKNYSKIEEVSGKYGTLTADKLGEFKEKTGEAIKAIVLGHTQNVEYYLSESEDRGKYKEMEDLVDKYGLKLPTKKDFFREKIAADIAEYESAVQRAEESWKRGFRFHPPARSLLNDIKKALSVCGEGILRHITESGNFDDWLEIHQGRIDAIKEADRKKEVEDDYATMITRHDNAVSTLVQTEPIQNMAMHFRIALSCLTDFKRHRNDNDIALVKDRLDAKEKELKRIMAEKFYSNFRPALESFYAFLDRDDLDATDLERGGYKETSTCKTLCGWDHDEIGTLDSIREELSKLNKRIQEFAAKILEDDDLVNVTKLLKAKELQIIFRQAINAYSSEPEADGS